MKQKRDVGIIILNYNTSEDAIHAAKSVIETTKLSYIICIADNCSTKRGEVSVLRNARLPNVEILEIKNNGGYAKGNNEAVRYLIENYDFTYIVIMNPDVLVINDGTLDRLVTRFQHLAQEYCGIQPMVWTPYLGDAKMQTHIRTVYSYWECIVNHSAILKRLFKKTFNATVYQNEKPYCSELDFEVPSGAFFLIRTDVFDDVGMFDERTFLYGEEAILGAKIKNNGYKFKFMPSEIVLHEGGKSIGSSPKRVKWYAVKYGMQSIQIYLKYYLHCNSFQIALVKAIMVLNFLMKNILYRLGVNLH